jgi:hypothetical protein
LREKPAPISRICGISGYHGWTLWAMGNGSWFE